MKSRIAELVALKVATQYKAVWPMLGTPVRAALIDAAVLLQLQAQDESVTSECTGTALLAKAAEWQAGAIEALAARHEMSL